MIEEIKEFLENKNFIRLYNDADFEKTIKFYKKDININSNSVVTEISIKKLNNENYNLIIDKNFTDGNEEKGYNITEKYFNETEKFIKSRIILL